LQKAYSFANAPIVYACTRNFLHPLCAVISCKVAEYLANIKEGSRISDVWKEIGAKTIFFEEERIFTNVNSMADYEAVKNFARH
jgi:molybdopterin-guanine dinucleotide biosynthesis protein A